MRNLRLLLWAAALGGVCFGVQGRALAGGSGPEIDKIRASTRDSVIVQSRTIAPGDTNVTIAIRLVNSMPVMGLTAPLEFRAVTPGAFVTCVALGFRERLKTALSGARFANHYAKRDYECPDSHAPGYQGIVASEVNWSVPVTSSPWGVLFSAFRFLPNPSLTAGADSAGSLTLTVAVSRTKGTFEIDTACTYPSNHLVLVGEHPEGGLAGLIPVFVKGVITIGACDCKSHGDINGDGAIDALDYSRLIDHVFFGGKQPPKDASCPHVNRGDLNCDGKADIRDVLQLREHLDGSGIAACQPCACVSYPVDCP